MSSVLVGCTLQDPDRPPVHQNVETILESTTCRGNGVHPSYVYDEPQ